MGAIDFAMTTMAATAELLRGRGLGSGQLESATACALSAIRDLRGIELQVCWLARGLYHSAMSTMAVVVGLLSVRHRGACIGMSRPRWDGYLSLVCKDRSCPCRGFPGFGVQGLGFRGSLLVPPEPASLQLPLGQALSAGGGT